MKNIALGIDEKVLATVRQYAAQQGSSVKALAWEYLSFEILFTALMVVVFVTGHSLVNAEMVAEPSECLVVAPGSDFIVVYPDNALPVEQTAAEELAKYVGKAVDVSATALPESELGAGRDANAYVGRCELTRKEGIGKELDREEFEIAIHHGRLFIVGDDEKGRPFAGNKRTGTLFGVYDFLENQVGVAWIWPGESGEDVPALKELRLGPFTRRDHPRLMYRGLKFSAAYPEPKAFKTRLSRWFKQMKLSNTTKSWYGHSWGSYLKEAGPEHPEWFALWNGKRQGPHYCTSNKEFRDFIVHQCLHYPKNKGFSVVSISPNDGYGFCECEKCRALDPPDTDYSTGIPNLSNRHWDYANYVAREVGKKNPELGVGMLAYTAYNKPPTNIDSFERNLYTQLCYSMGYFVKPDKKKEFLDNTTKWSRKGLKFTMYEYWGMHYWLDLPYIITRQMNETMPILYETGLSGMKSEAAKNFATQAPNYYLGSHLLWNPKMDGEKVLDRFYEAFGPASEHVRGYYDTFELAILEHQDKRRSFAYLEVVNTWPEVFPESVLLEAGSFLKKAKDAVSNDPVRTQRVELVEIGYNYTRVMLELLGIYRRLGRAGVPLWCFGYQGAVAELDFWKEKSGLSDMPKAWVEFWKRHPDQPLDKAEKLKLLKRAIELGDERERMLNAHAEQPSMSLGMYTYFKQRGLYQWHETVKSEWRSMQPEP